MVRFFDSSFPSIYSLSARRGIPGQSLLETAAAMENLDMNVPDELPNLTKTTKMTLSPLPSKDPITCHVLDTTSGAPARGLGVSLTLVRPFGPSAPFKAVTNNDGRVSNWNVQNGPPLSSIIENLHEHPDGMIIWELLFQTGDYFGSGKTFWPEVRVQFYTDASDKDGHYHVPLLLGPWSYTTYRGS